MTYQEAVTAWVAAREGLPVVSISDVFVDGMDEGSPCGNDTCWFEANVSLSFTLEDEERETRSYDIGPGTFVREVAAIAKAVSDRG